MVAHTNPTEERSTSFVMDNLSPNYVNNDEQLTLLAAAVHSSHDSIVITTTDLDYPGPEIVFVNKAFTKMTGYQPSEIIGKNPRILQGPNTDRTIFKELKQLLHVPAKV